MSVGSKNCPSCDHANSVDAMFCSKCGTRLPPKPAEAEPAADATAPELSAPEALAADADADAAAGSRPDAGSPDAAAADAGSPDAAAADTGGPEGAAVDAAAEGASTDSAGAAASAEAEPTGAPDVGAEPAPRPAQPRRRVAGAARTMLGVPAPKVGESAPAPSGPSSSEEPSEEPPAKGPKKRVPGTARTMLGMPAPDAAKIQAAVDQAKAQAAAVAPSEPAASPRVDVASTAAGLGPAPAASPAPAAPPRKRAGALDPTTNRTMLGQPAPRPDLPEDEPPPRASTSEPPGGRGRAPVIYPADTGEEDALTLPSRRPRGLAMAVLAIGVVALLVGGGALVWTLSTSGSDLQATVAHGDDGEALVVEVPGAAEGTRVRFHGAEEPLEAGRARFMLSADDLTLGDNELTVDVVSPDGSVESHAVRLHLEMRVRADLGPLESAPPAIDVVVEAPSGSDVTLDGDALELDGQGRGTRRFSIDGAGANAEGVVEHVVRYRIQPPEGESEQGELRTRIPLTTMQIDRPGTQVVTDRESVEVAGAVAPGSTVTVDGEEVEVRMGRFLHTLALPALGERTVEVVARASGKAPHVARLEIRRVEDLEAEAAEFDANEELTYARIAQNPNTYRGQRVAFDGLVYNVDVRNGRSVIQILVSDCPEGDRCPLWVTYPAATDAEMRSRVRVLGTVAGEQQFRAQNGQVRTVPRVDATFVLPAGAGGRRR